MRRCFRPFLNASSRDVYFLQSVAAFKGSRSHPAEICWRTIRSSPTPRQQPSWNDPMRVSWIIFCPFQINRSQGRLSSTGITALALTKHFVAIGAHACDSCRLLKSVDLCNTNVEEIPEFTFVHCTSLREVLLPTTLRTIRIKAFMNCAALVELAIPPSLRYIGSRAFLDCTVFSRLAKMPGRQKWRGVCFTLQR